MLIGTGAVHDRAVIDVDLSPGANHDFVARPDDVIRRDRNVLHRRKGAGRAAKQVGAENAQSRQVRLQHESWNSTRSRNPDPAALLPSTFAPVQNIPVTF